MRNDITAMLQADIKGRDWSAVHIASDRSKPIRMPDRRRRHDTRSRGIGIFFRRGNGEEGFI